MESHGLGMEGEFYVESVTSLPAWNSEYEGRFVSFNNGLYYGESSKWVKLQEKSDIEGTVDTDVIHYHPSGNGIAGYVGGGGHGGGDTVDKLIFSNDNIASITSRLSSEKRDSAGFNSLENGFAAGGDYGATTSVVDKLNFSNDNIASITSKLSNATKNAAGFNSQENGYIAGGGIILSIVEKLRFSDDRILFIASKLSTIKSNAAGFNSQENGFVAGGTVTYYTPSYYHYYISVVDKLNFSNDNIASITSKLSTVKGYAAGFNSQDNGFVAGGNTGVSPFINSVVDKLNFSNDNIANITSKLSTARQYPAGFNSQENGFVAGGSDTSVVDKLNFSNDNIARLTSKLSDEKHAAAGFEN